jgi:hypothetical protein
MPRWLTSVLVFSIVIAGFSACASTAPNRANQDQPQEEKRKPSEPFRY